MTPPPPPAASAAPRRVAPVRRAPAPRRVSGPTRTSRVAAPPSTNPLVGGLTKLIDLPGLDRLIRGRVWIGIIAVALLGIVTMQVTLLRLNTEIGTTVAKSTTLQSENTALAQQIAEEESSVRVLGAAAAMGMVSPAAGAVTFLNVGPGDVARAASALQSWPSSPPNAPSTTAGSDSTAVTDSTTSVDSAAAGDSAGTSDSSTSGDSTASAVGAETTPTTTSSTTPAATDTPVASTPSDPGAAVVGAAGAAAAPTTTSENSAGGETASSAATGGAGPGD